VIVGLAPGANPTTAIYNASAVKIYHATGSLVRFEIKKLFYYWRCSCELKFTDEKIHKYIFIILY
jgi:hypothetical protein